MPVALVTCGARGIGRAIVENLSADHDVALTWNSTQPDAALGAHAIQADLTQDGAARAVVESVMAKFGRLDVIVNNAGLVLPTPKDAFDAADHRAVLDVNLIAPIALLSAALSHLQRGAAIINISSVNAVLPPVTRQPLGPARRR